MLKFLLYIFILLAHLSTFAQNNQEGKVQVNVRISDTKGYSLNNEMVVFRDQAEGTEFKGNTDSTGKISLNVPAGTKYNIFIPGFRDSTNYNTLDIPPSKDDASLKKPVNLNIQVDRPVSFVSDNCTFEKGKAALTAKDCTILDELVRQLKKLMEKKIEIAGHADNSEIDADRLSQSRANSVRAYLINKGITADRIITKGYGITQPSAENMTAEGRQLNRRVEIITLE